MFIRRRSLFNELHSVRIAITIFEVYVHLSKSTEVYVLVRGLIIALKEATDVDDWTFSCRLFHCLMPYGRNESE